VSFVDFCFCVLVLYCFPVLDKMLNYTVISYIVLCMDTLLLCSKHIWVSSFKSVKPSKLLYDDDDDDDDLEAVLKTNICTKERIFLLEKKKINHSQNPTHPYPNRL